MLDQKMSALARDLEDGVELPALAGLVDRGASLRRRRRGVGAGVAALCLVALGYLATQDRDPTTAPPPAIEPKSSVAEYPGGLHYPDLEAGTYAMRVGTDRGEVTAEVTVPGGWRGWLGPNRVYRHGYVALLVQDVAAVFETPCSADGMAQVGDAPADLVRRLTRLPHHELVEAPVPDDRFGVPSTHLVLQATDGARCGDDTYFGLWSPGGPLPIWSFGPGSRLELWVLDVDGEAVLVAAASSSGVPARGLDELADVADSVEIVH